QSNAEVKRQVAVAKVITKNEKLQDKPESDRQKEAPQGSPNSPPSASASPPSSRQSEASAPKTPKTQDDPNVAGSAPRRESEETAVPRAAKELMIRPIFVRLAEPSPSGLGQTEKQPRIRLNGPNLEIEQMELLGGADMDLEAEFKHGGNPE